MLTLRTWLAEWKERLFLTKCKECSLWARRLVRIANTSCISSLSAFTRDTQVASDLILHLHYQLHLEFEEHSALAASLTAQIGLQSYEASNQTKHLIICWLHGWSPHHKWENHPRPLITYLLCNFWRFTYSSLASRPELYISAPVCTASRFMMGEYTY